MQFIIAIPTWIIGVLIVFAIGGMYSLTQVLPILIAALAIVILFCILWYRFPKVMSIALGIIILCLAAYIFLYFFYIQKADIEVEIYETTGECVVYTLDGESETIPKDTYIAVWHRPGYIKETGDNGRLFYNHETYCEVLRSDGSTYEFTVAGIPEMSDSMRIDQFETDEKTIWVRELVKTTNLFDFEHKGFETIAT